MAVYICPYAADGLIGHGGGFNAGVRTKVILQLVNAGKNAF